MTITGKLGAGGNQRAALVVPVPSQPSEKAILPHRTTEEVQLPFVVELKRPDKVRFELEFNEGSSGKQDRNGAQGYSCSPGRI